MSDRIICGYKPAPLGSNPARWPAGAPIRYRIALPGLPGIARDQFRAVFRAACDSWESVCGIEFQEVDTRETFTVTTMTQQPGGVLADCTLPYQFPVRMRVDAAEQWAIGRPIPTNLVVQAYGPPRPKQPTAPVDPVADQELFRLITRAGGLVLLVRDGLTVERMR